MSMMIQYQELWDKGGYGKDNPLENTIAFINKQAETLNYPLEVAEVVIHEVMMEVAAGKQFPLDKCPCGCGIDKSGTAITHEMLSRLKSLGRAVVLQQKDLLERRLNAAIVNHMQRENEQYIEKNTTSKWEKFKKWISSEQ